MSTGRLRIAAALVAACGLILAVPLIARAWPGDFFDGDASGQAVYEDMAIRPQAVRVGSRVYVAYQGQGLDPYVIAFEDSGDVLGPYKVGENPLADGANPDDSHGAPALLYDRASGYLHVFYGAHQNSLRHARTSMTDDPSSWIDMPSIGGAYTYPQVFTDDQGVHHLFMRSSSASDTWGSWVHSTSKTEGESWSRPQVVLRATSDQAWYARFEPGTSGRIHAAMVAYDMNELDPFVRKGVYCASLDASGTWRDAAGTSLQESATIGLRLADFTATITAGAVDTDTARFHNQISLVESADGAPALLYVSGPGTTSAYDWVFAKWNGSTWTTSTVADTDHFMDAGTLERGPGGEIDAFITRSGTPSAGPDPDRYVDRGGDIEWHRSTDGGASWGYQRTLATSDFDRGVVYNDPQIVLDHDTASPSAPQSRILFGEWNNDAGAMVHKVYLWGEDGFRGREFFPDTVRLSGSNRYETAVAISHEAFPNGADTVIVASGEVFADALAGGPLAEAYRAPLLLVPRDSVPSAVAAEIARLKAKTVIVLGGTATITDRNKYRLDRGSVSRVRRIAGADRYACATAIATELEKKKGTPKVAFIVSGLAFPDALSASSVAAARGVPILLSKPDGIPSTTRSWMRTREVTRTIVVGGPATLKPAVMSQLTSATRIWGPDRYSTAAAVARLGLDGGAGLPPSFSTTRISVASGLVFPDALAGAPLAARVRGPLVLTSGTSLSPAARHLLEQRAYRVLDCYLLGGVKTLSQDTAGQVVEILVERQEQ